MIAGEDYFIPFNFDAAEATERPHFGDALHGELPHDPSRPTVAIIGGGYAGVSSALHLTQDAPCLRVLLLEAGKIGQGPSGNNAGQVCGLQVSDAEVVRHCGSELGAQLITAAKNGMRLVRDLIAAHDISCDLRDGYVAIESNGQRAIEHDTQFGISPYPYLVGLARAAQKAGAVIHEDSPVLSLESHGSGYRLTTNNGCLHADYVVAAGGYGMIQTIPALRHLRSKTGEVKVTTLTTPPLSDEVLRAAMPDNPQLFPFATNESDIVYGSFAKNRNGLHSLIFGAHAAAIGDPDPARIEKKLLTVLPELPAAYQRVTGERFATTIQVRAKKINFTRDVLPLVHASGDKRLLVATAFCGHGIAMGTMLGKAVADQIRGHRTRNPDLAQVFEDFASIPHGWLPPWSPFREAAVEVVSHYERIRDKMKAWRQSPLSVPVI